MLYLTNSDKVALVDEQDHFKLLLLGPYHLIKGGYVRTNGFKNLYLHHLVAELMGLVGYSEIDHDNRDKLDNRRVNLKASTRSDNLCNTKLRTDSKSGHRFVLWSTQKNKWQVEINRDTHRRHVDFYDTIESAVFARDEYLRNSDLKVGDL